MRRSSPGWPASRGSPRSPPSADPQTVAQRPGAEDEAEDDDAGDRQQGVGGVGGVDAGDDRLAHPFDDEAERVVFGDRLRRLDHQFDREEGRREEEDDEDEREEALDDAGAAGAQG